MRVSECSDILINQLERKHSISQRCEIRASCIMNLLPVISVALPLLEERANDFHTAIIWTQWFINHWFLFLPLCRLGRWCLTTCNFLFSCFSIPFVRNFPVCPTAISIVFINISSLVLSSLLFSFSVLFFFQWYTVQHYLPQKMAFSSKMYVTTTSMQPVVCDASQVLTYKEPASDCARLMAPGQGHQPAAEVRRKLTSNPIEKWKSLQVMMSFYSW